MKAKLTWYRHFQRVESTKPCHYLWSSAVQCPHLNSEICARVFICVCERHLCFHSLLSVVSTTNICQREMKIHLIHFLKTWYRSFCEWFVIPHTSIFWENNRLSPLKPCLFLTINLKLTFRSASIQSTTDGSRHSSPYISSFPIIYF